MLLDERPLEAAEGFVRPDVEPHGAISGGEGRAGAESGPGGAKNEGVLMMEWMLWNPIGRRVIAIVVLIALIWGFVEWQRAIGREELRQRIERDNENAGNVADAAALGLSECLAADGVFWDFAAGQCRGAKTGGR